MLVLTRKSGEEIVIGDQIRVTVLLVDGQRVRLGVTAPRRIRVVRPERLADLPAPPAPAEGEPSGAAG